MTKAFDPKTLKKLYQPAHDSSGEDNGQVTIIGGSYLFHGAPLLSLKVASRIVDMVFFASPQPSVGKVAELVKSKLSSFIWVPWEEVGEYVKKSDAALIGPGLMRYEGKIQNSKFKVQNDKAGKLTREITEKLLADFPSKKWVIDAGSLQVTDADWIPKNAILTPNRKELETLFGEKLEVKDQGLVANLQALASEYNCIINCKGPSDLVCSAGECVEIKDGNPGMTKGGTGDVLAGLTVALLAKNEPFLASAAASYVTKAAADRLYKKVGIAYNADDLADEVPEVLHRLTS
jgi:hydroxyethylthiazole kinase-like uncharacterized protein yjeF